MSEQSELVAGLRRFCDDGKYPIAGEAADALESAEREKREATDALMFLRNDWSPFGARSCPACEYREGVFIRACKLHEALAEAEQRAEASAKDAAEWRKTAEFIMEKKP